MEKADINQALRKKHGRKLDELQPCYTDRFDVYIKVGPTMPIEQCLLEAETFLNEFGAHFWAQKIQAIRLSDSQEDHKAHETLKLFGGFGSLNDMAFSDEDAPLGLSGEDATRQWFRAINQLHAKVTAHVA